MTKAVRTVALVIPTPPPRWGSSVWRPPAWRVPATAAETGPLAERARTVLSQGIWIWRDPFFRETAFGQPVPHEDHATGYEWRHGNWNYLTSPSGRREKA